MPLLISRQWVGPCYPSQLKAGAIIEIVNHDCLIIRERREYERQNTNGKQWLQPLLLLREDNWDGWAETMWTCRAPLLLCAEDKSHPFPELLVSSPFCFLDNSKSWEIGTIAKFKGWRILLAYLT